MEPEWGDEGRQEHAVALRVALSLQPRLPERGCEPLKYSLKWTYMAYIHRVKEWRVYTVLHIYGAFKKGVYVDAIV